MTAFSKITIAQTATAESLWKVLRDHDPAVISAATLNRNLTEDMAVYIAKNRSAGSDTLEFLASDIRFKESYKLKLALCKNPKTPQRVTLSLLKFLRIFDLADLSKDQRIPSMIRQKIEQTVSDKVASMPAGVKIALAKRANSSLVMVLMEYGDERVIQACLDSPALTEGHLYKVINKPAVKRHVIKIIAEHPKWSLRYYIRFALIRNFYTPMSLVARFIRAMKIVDLKDLYTDRKLPSSTKPFIFRELLERAETIETQKEELYDLSDEDSTASGI
ncbi:MAG TPA: hypothetical protein DCP92_03535 [Nitrospiraceae bacterium]|nr:hypothetical protein [Nitrospiraceae bacterium]